MFSGARVDGSRLVSVLLSLADDIEGNSTDDGEDEDAEGKRTKDDPSDVPTAETTVVVLVVDARSARSVSSGTGTAPVRKGAEEGVVGGVEDIVGTVVENGGKVSSELVEVEVKVGQLGEASKGLGQVSLDLVVGQAPVVVV